MEVEMVTDKLLSERRHVVDIAPFPTSPGACARLTASFRSNSLQYVTRLREEENYDMIRAPTQDTQDTSDFLAAEPPNPRDNGQL
jgi:hypothetical protein